MSDIFETGKNLLPKPKYDYITTNRQASDALNYLSNCDILSIDTETTGLDPFTCKLTLLQITAGEKNFVFDTRNDLKYSSLDLTYIDKILQDKSKIKILQNAGFDMKILKVKRGYYLENVYDTMLAERILILGLSSRGTGLADLVLKYLGLNMPKEPRSTFKDYHQEFKPFQLEYAANDTVPLELIRDLQLPKIKKEGLERTMQLEFDFLIPLCEMELNGILVDTKKWSIIMDDIDRDRINLRGKIQKDISNLEIQNTLFDVPIVNIDSNSQLKTVLNKYGLNLEGTSVDELSKYAGVPVVDNILDYRKKNKLITTYSENLLDRINSVTGRLHTDFNQMVSTGRLSSAKPNLQNIPHDQIFRSCFIAKEGYTLITADMANAELRILGNFSLDPIFVESYKVGQDIHTRTAAEVFGVNYDDVTKDQRNAAKAINFGLCVSEDTEVVTDSGINCIADAKVGSLISHDLGADKIIDKRYMGQKEVFEIETEYGYKLEVTEDHLVKVIDAFDNYVDKPLREIDVVKDKVCLRFNSNLFSNDTVYFDDFKIKQNTNFIDIELPKELDNNLASFLGLFVSEGSIQKVKGRNDYGNVSFGFSKDDMEFIKEVDKLFNDMFGDRISINDKKYKRYSLNSVLFANWLNSIVCLDLEDNKTDNMRVPDCIKAAPKDKQILFLRWLYAGDGSVKKNLNGHKISYSSNSFLLVKDVQHLLLNFGIISSITEETRKGSSKKHYVLSVISTKCHEVFINTIGFVTKSKSDRCVSVVKYNCSSYFIDHYGNKIEDIINKNKELDTYDNFFKFIYENDIVPLKIRSINTKGFKKVYDLSVANHHYFLANGFIIHNCYGMSPVGLAKKLNINKKKAEDILNKYFNVYKDVKKYLDNSGKEAILRRYSKSVGGRKRYYNLPEYSHPDFKMIKGSVERKGKNMPIQSSNADTIKKAMIYVVDRIKDYDAKLLLTVHDEVVVEVVNEQAKEVSEIVTSCLIDGFGDYFSTIPMESDTLLGPCWLKDPCENKVDGKKCGCAELRFDYDEKYGTKLVCPACGNVIV